MSDLIWYVLAASAVFIAVFFYRERIRRLIRFLNLTIEKNFADPVAGDLIRYRLTADHLSALRGMGALIVAWLMLRFGVMFNIWWMIGTGLPLAVTDQLDGAMARKTQCTARGKIIDPISDKVFKVVYSARFIGVPSVGYMLWLMYLFYLVSLGLIVFAPPKNRVQSIADTFAANDFGKGKGFLQYLAIGYLYLVEAVQGTANQNWQPALLLILFSLILDARSVVSKIAEYRRNKTIPIRAIN